MIARGWEKINPSGEFFFGKIEEAWQSEGLAIFGREVYNKIYK